MCHAIPRLPDTTCCAVCSSADSRELSGPTPPRKKLSLPSLKTRPWASQCVLARLPQLMNVRQIAMFLVLGEVRCAKTISHRVTDPTNASSCFIACFSSSPKLRVNFCFKALFGSIVPLETASPSCDSKPSRSPCFGACGCEILFKAACASVDISSGVFPHMRFDILLDNLFLPDRQPPCSDENPVLRASVFSVVRQAPADTKRLAKLHPKAQRSTQVTQQAMLPLTYWECSPEKHAQIWQLEVP